MLRNSHKEAGHAALLVERVERCRTCALPLRRLHWGGSSKRQHDPVC